MALKPIVDSLDTVPEAVRDLYVESDGKFALQVEGMVPKDKVDGFRSNNLALKKQVEEYQAKFNGIDPEKARELLSKQQQIEEKKLIEAGDVDAIVQQRVAGLIKDHQSLVSKITSERDGLQQQLHTHLVHGEVRTEAVKAGVRKEALEDVILRSDRVFKPQDGRPAAFNGNEMLYGKDGVTPLRPAEWLMNLKDSAPHLFEPSQGTGARPAQATSSAAPGTPAVGPKQVHFTDKEGLLANREAIIKGEVKVVG